MAIYARRDSGAASATRFRRPSVGGLVRWGSVSFVFKALLAVALGTALGLWATQAAVNRGFLFASVADGPWVAFPTVGSGAIDPYAKAVLARTAFLPIGADEGIAFYAASDSDGRPLTGDCRYLLESAEPAARFWSLGLFDRSGHVVANPANRYAITSQEAVRMDHKVTIAIAPDVQPGNWLPSPDRRPFTLAMSLYESSSGTAVATAADTVLPVIRRVSCRS